MMFRGRPRPIQGNTAPTSSQIFQNCLYLHATNHLKYTYKILHDDAQGPDQDYVWLIPPIHIQRDRPKSTWRPCHSSHKDAPIRSSQLRRGRTVHLEFSSSTTTQLPSYIHVPSWSENWTVYQSVSLARWWLFLAVREGEHNFSNHHHHHRLFHAYNPCIQLISIVLQRQWSQMDDKFYGLASPIPIQGDELVNGHCRDVPSNSGSFYI